MIREADVVPRCELAPIVEPPGGDLHGMRALLGPLNPVAHRAVAGDLDGLDVRCFDRRDAEIAFDPAREPLEALWGRLPHGWSPDCLIWWSPEYSLVPEGVERCPVPTIAVLGDWNLGVWSTAPLLEAFDWVVTDRLGVRLLGSQLGVPVDHWPAFAFDRALHRRDPGRDRDVDVLFVGNTNPDVQVERASWLARLARIGGRRRVVLASGVFGDAYADLLRRSRIVWNRSIRGEMNMRAYEAPACGALLLMETENLEVRAVFEDGVSCALHGAGDLEAVVDRYLDDPAALDRVALAGWQRVQRETYPQHLADLLDRAATLAPGRRPFGELPAWRRRYWLGVHALGVPAAEGIDAALAHLSRAVADGAPAGPIAGALGALGVVSAFRAAPADRRRRLESASRLFAAGVAAGPGDVVARMNLGWTRAACGDADGARASWLAARAALAGDAPFPVDRPPAPFPFDRFRVEWERGALEPDAGARAARFRPLLAARVASDLATLETAPESRVQWLAEAVQASAGVAGNVHRLARELEAVGDDPTALVAWTRVLDANPFDWDARVAAVGVARRSGDVAAVDRLLGEARVLVGAVPGAAHALDALTVAAAALAA